MSFLEDILRQASVAIKPSIDMRVSQTAELRELNNPGSYVGKWDNKFAPYLVEPMDEMGSIYFDSLIFAGPARCGKSDMFFNYFFHIQRNDPSDFMLVHMTKTTARDWSIGDLRKNFRNTPEFGAMVMPGRQNLNVHDIHFIGDTRLLVKWPTVAELSGKTVPRHWLMDYDRMTQDVEGEGPPFRLTYARANTFSTAYRMTVAESSPGFQVELPEDVTEWEPESPHEAPPTQGILNLYNAGDRRRWQWRCTNCGDAFEGEFEHIKWDKKIKDPRLASQTARLHCPHCDFAFTHDANPAQGQPGKNGLNLKGKWIKDGQIWESDGSISGVARQSLTASFWLKGVAAAFQTWETLTYKYIIALNSLARTNKDGDLKTTINVDQGYPYWPQAKTDRIQVEDLMRRPRFYKKGEVPEQVRFLVATIDVQNNRFEVLVTGFDEYGTAYIVDRFNIRYSKREDTETDEDGQFQRIDPASYPEDWHLLIEKVIEKKYPLADESGRVMGIHMSACDSAGKEGFTVNAYAFWKFLKNDELRRGYHDRFLLLKGASSADAPQFALRYPNTDRKDRKAKARGEIPVGFIGTLVQKDKVYGMLGKDDGVGGVKFCDGLARWVYTELLVEVRTDTKWENPKRLRNETFDCLVYAVTILNHRRVKFDKIDFSDIDKTPEWARPQDENSLVSFINEDGEVDIYDEPKPRRSLSELGTSLA